MLSPEQLKEQISKYDSGQISLGQFEDWFYDESIDPIEEPQLEQWVSAVDSALSARHFEGLRQDDLRTRLRELAKAVRQRRELSTSA